MQKKTAKKHHKKINWSNAKARYISGQESYREIADDLEVTLSVLSKKAQSNDWKIERKKYREKTAKKALHKTMSKDVNLLAKELTIADAFLNKLLRDIQDPNQFNLHIIKKGFEEVEVRLNKTDYNAILKAISTLKILNEIKKEALGVMTVEAKARIGIERERLELEKKKLAHILIEPNTKEISGIVMLPEIIAEEVKGDE